MPIRIIVQLSLSFVGGVFFVWALYKFGAWKPKNKPTLVLMMLLGGILACILVPIQ
ncbi:MAG: hypothetical protein US63_C0006G0007 [Candidatus Moranbacteria bacterium GW2011_GWC2_37_8]|nr:MAG: hypothetical protein US63_C0006G0007 [Candidatus Moranbacteria bacterium GW2011_GWC2_37_8]KKQ62433.1 MAG: hypothetical protein US82_C0011G0007 [Parcubacteria group bacterium GW2011_GWC1_38_22]KKQ80291.1 MAG: hypothetical protein UT03_C0028G0007 [Candidatus Moranbacteria bacterium GW2011_GWD2_38_7]